MFKDQVTTTTTTTTTKTTFTADGRGCHAILAPLIKARAVYYHLEHPQHVSGVLMIRNMRLFGIWPKSWQEENIFYSLYNRLVVMLLTLFAATLTFDLYEASGNVVHFGDNLAMLMGFFLILIKFWIISNRVPEIESIIGDLNFLHTNFATYKMGDDLSEVRRMQRTFFLGECAAYLVYGVLGILFEIAVSVQPQFSNQALPLRAKFPYGLHDPARHPYAFAAIYAFQCFCTLYNLFSIILIENLCCHTCSQVTLNLRILCMRIRRLGKRKLGVVTDDMWSELREIVEAHQYIIRLVDKINRCFYAAFVVQLAASTLILCLTAFVALIARDQPMVAMKFVMYMILAMNQLFYWCWMGNLVYYDSLELATAAFEIHKWFEQSPRLQRNLMFFIQRAQKPLLIRAKPFNPFTFQTFGGILSSSYSYFALLRTILD